MPNITLSIPESSFGLRMTTTFICSPPFKYNVVHPLKQYIHGNCFLLLVSLDNESKTAFHFDAGAFSDDLVADTDGE